MPKKNSSDSVSSFWEKYKHFIIPSAFGGFIAWFFSDSFKLGVMVFIVVWIGNYLGKKMLDK